MTAYGVEAVRIFDAYDFRDRMEKAKAQPKAFDLAEPPSGNQKAWWQRCFDKGDYKSRDRELFSALPGQPSTPSGGPGVTPKPKKTKPKKM